MGLLGSLFGKRNHLVREVVADMCRELFPDVPDRLQALRLVEREFRKGGPGWESVSEFLGVNGCRGVVEGEMWPEILEVIRDAKIAFIRGGTPASFKELGPITREAALFRNPLRELITKRLNDFPDVQLALDALEETTLQWALSDINSTETQQVAIWAIADLRLELVGGVKR